MENGTYAVCYSLRVISFVFLDYWSELVSTNERITFSYVLALRKAFTVTVR